MISRRGRCAVHFRIRIWVWGDLGRCGGHQGQGTHGWVFSLSIICPLSSFSPLSLSSLSLNRFWQILSLVKQWTIIYCFEQSYQKKISSTDDLSPEISFLYEIDVYLNECLTICVLETARKIAPCIVFIDEIDSLASNRTHSLYTTEAANQTLNQLLTELDG